jgi:release factor glutamine methyltransferase
MTNLLQTVRKQLTKVYDRHEADAIAFLLLEERFGISKCDLLVGKDIKFSPNEDAELQVILSRLGKGEPVQYVLGHTDFCGLDILVNKNVLIPRPETEGLVEWATEFLTSYATTDSTRILDVCTGSGCIALAMKNKFAQADVYGIDISDGAVSVAQENSRRLSLPVNMTKADALNLSASYSKTPFDLIMSNPPYVRECEKEEMETNVLDFEPHLALFVSNSDPTIFYREITKFAIDSLKHGGAIFFEVNRLFGDDVEEILRATGFISTEIRNDMFGNVRMVKGVKP